MFRFLEIEVVHWDYWERFSLPMESDVITVVGPNGSGKTTLLDLMRTLLCIDCSSGRDYKRYVRRNNKPVSWLRAVVDNERHDSGLRPFFPLLDTKVTLACQIRKKGGDWQRQYLIAEGDVPIENLQEQDSWIGVREYRNRLEQAGLTHAIRHVLSLEQGDTDKLCEYSPRQLLELVFSVFGDQEVLDNYQQAKSEQAEIGRELEKLEDELAHLNLRLREAESNVNSFREWESINKEHEKLMFQTLPCAELAELQTKIASGRVNLNTKRSELNEIQGAYDKLLQRKQDLLEVIDLAKSKEQELEAAEKVALERFTHCRDKTRDAEKVLADKENLEELCRQQEQGFDAAALSAEQREKREKLSEKNHELKTIRLELRELKARLAALKSGEKIEPDFVKKFRRNLDQEKINHRLLTEIVEVKDPVWQKALEGVLGPFAHIVLLKDPADRRQAWELGEKLRYRHFVVAERNELPNSKPKSLLEVVRFLEPPPEWLANQLNNIRRVDSVKEGNTLSNDVSWITPEGYHRERRGGRYIGVDPARYQFGEAARKNLISDFEVKISQLDKREREISQQIEPLSRRIDEIQALNQGVDATGQLAARSSEFARIEAEYPRLAEIAQEASATLTSCMEKLKNQREERHKLEMDLRGIEVEVRKDEKFLHKASNDFRTLKEHQAERASQFRYRRNSMPSLWYSGSALAELREQFESPEAVRREIKRIKERLEQGSWVIDEKVVGIQNKIQEDYTHLEGTIKTRRIHHNRHITATEDARESYINVLRATIRSYSRNVKSLGELAGIGVEIDPPHLLNDDVTLAQAGLGVKFNFDEKGMIGLNDGEASGGQQVMKSLILLIALLMDEHRAGGFVFIDEPFAHLDVFNIDKVGAFLQATNAQYVLTTPNTHNVNVFKTSDLTLVTQKRRHPSLWAPPVAFLRRERRESEKT